MSVSASDGFVVVGVKEGPASVAAARWAVGESTARHLDLVVAHGYTYPFSHEPLPPDTVSLIEGSARELVDQVLSQLVIPAGLVVRTVVEPGIAMHLLTRLSKQASLVVLGRDQLTTFGRITQGATTAAVCADSGCPVVVVPPYLRPAVARQPVIVAVDGVTSAIPALRVGFDEAAQRLLPLLVLHAGSESDGPDDAQARRRNVEEILAGWKEDHPDVLVQIEVVAGDPADTIRDHADHAGLMVVGRAHQRRFRSWSQSVASAVLDHCRCPLVIAPEASMPDLDQRAEVHPVRTVPVPQP